MFGLNRDWFYLTLWRGTPPDFTEEITAEIQDADAGSAIIYQADSADSYINTMASAFANIECQEAISTHMITSTEVIWYVGQ